MRMTGTGIAVLRNKRGTPVRAKGRPAGKVAHQSAPLKGLSRNAELNEGDPLLASILTNWVVEDDRITVRPGYNILGTISGGPAISSLVPHIGSTSKFAAAASGKFYDTSGTELASGYSNDNWAWTIFSDLGDAEYTVMVNGADGVVSWDGTTFADETITVPTAETWIDPLTFDKVYAHMNRLWFADTSNLALYYLPIQQKAGQVELFPLNAIFRRGGHIVALHSWSIDGGSGMDDALVVFTSNGECAIYSGVDPESDFKLVGVFRFDSPMSKSSIINFGGDLYVMISTGFVPMTTLLRSETEQLGKADLNVMQEFEEISRSRRDFYGWSVILNSHSNHAICNMPLGGGKYQQLIRKMPGQVWTKWIDIPSRCWLWFENRAYFGTDDGRICRLGPDYLNDAGEPIHANVRFAWSSYKSFTEKQFKMVKLYILTDGHPKPFVDMEVDYTTLTPINQPDVTTGAGSEGAEWDLAEWDTSDWAAGIRPVSGWQGVTGLGRVAAPHVRVAISGCTLSITGIDVLYELGGLI